MRRDLSGFLRELEERLPHDLVRVERAVSPAHYEVTALLQHLENDRKFPALLFDKPLDVDGKPSSFPLLSNLFATRRRCALALGLDPNDEGLALSLEYARREQQLIAPVVIPADEAPVKEIVKQGNEANVYEFPVVRHHAMDPAPYLDMTPVMKDPEGGFYNVAFLRNMVKGPRRLGIHMSPRHNWQIHRKNEEKKRPTPIAIVVSHHPAFYLGALNVSPFGVDDYARIGAIMGAPLRLTASESWGKDFLVPADAEIVIEGQVLPNVKEAEGPFGEFTGYYGPQRLRWVIEVTAVTHRRHAIFQHIFTGHRDTWVLGGIPKEGSLFNLIRGVVPTARAVHFPTSGCCRFHCYIAIDKKVDGETKQAALAALGGCDFVKHVVVVDADINIYNEEEVLWAVATRVQADQAVDIIKNVKGNTLDPSQTDDIMTAKMIIDATRPVRKAYAARVEVPKEAMAKSRLEDFIPRAELERLPKA
ncbi:MAG: UbiD family decarboxylase [Deltaproteobacteria bacterium]|nr:UbiD family decarboxylase [Deltaproteobacteria bacterium]MBI2991813.1 UbiD family decarboxylase [Deltaproteobacteria bacterium]